MSNTGCIPNRVCSDLRRSVSFTSICLQAKLDTPEVSLGRSGGGSSNGETKMKLGELQEMSGSPNAEETNYQSRWVS